MKVYAADELDIVLNAARGQSFEAALIVREHRRTPAREGLRSPERRVAIRGYRWEAVEFHTCQPRGPHGRREDGDQGRKKRTERPGVYRQAPCSERLREIMEDMTSGTIWL